ncbi:ABC transporter permease [Opitutus terrae]|uniref:Permease n=1 Tax=Opitutus terrae (strain DSM 11246 / JCM 15787 / PB90-1) TaxID=452637 RepID=B1ZXX4_OPITP|nr:ABC transporter permease [Opitutus terrae]ACB75176.1 permease [Opitutus terrae PB90-1]
MPVRLALRALLKSPGYTTIALLTLALGIGVNTSMFSLVDALLFRSTPFPDSAQLYEVVASSPTFEARRYSYLELREIREQLTAFPALTTLVHSQYTVSEPGQPAERIGGIMVSEDFFATFRVPPLIGRVFSPEEHQPGRNDVILLSYAFWQTRFGGATDVIGRTLRLDGRTTTIIGVMPPAFDYRMLWGGAAFWRPLNFTRDQIEWRDYRVFSLIGRLPATSPASRVAAELAPVGATQEKLFPESYSGIRYHAVPLHEALMDTLGRRVSLLLLGLSAFVLLIACANLANLQLARATANVRDLAIRAALGASRRRLIYQQLVESVLLSLAGGALGVGLALVLNRVIETNFVISGSTGAVHIRLDPRVLAATLLVSLLTGLLFGIVPAWLASRTDVNTALKQQTRGGTAGRGHHRIRQTLVVAEVALALVLLSGAAILQRGFADLLDRHTGWDTDHIITAALPIPETRTEYETEAKRAELFRRLEERLARIPGVEQAAIATSLPVFTYNGDRRVFIDGQSQMDPNLPAAFHVMASANYFATMGIPLVEGQLYAPDIKVTDPRVILVNEALARRLWPNDTAVGKRLASMDSGKPYWAEIIGVVRDVDTAASTRDPSTPYQVYKPLAQEAWGYVHLVLRSRTPEALGETLRRAVSDFDPDLAVAYTGTVQQLVDSQQHNLRLAGKTLTAFAVLGLALAAVGLYGVIAHVVAQRTGEFGIRLALGAQPHDVLRLVLAQALRLTGVGLVLGIVGAFALSRVLSGLMPRVVSLDLVALLGVAAVLLVVAIIASWIPARRATKVDPLIALRAE